MREAIDLRVTVFVDEQRVPMEEEVDVHDTSEDATAVHAIVREDRRVLACGRLYGAGVGIARIGRMAVARGVRGRGVGRYLLEALLARAHELGYRRATVSAQVHAVGFYGKAGFSVNGAEYLDAGITHVDMSRPL